MAYIGNDVRSNEDYKIIDDISSGFNGSATSFALQVGGATPVPFPKFEQQLLISVNGVIQEPDPTGSAGFKLLGTNIVFSSAPTNGHAFFGVIYAGADYVNAGGTFPDGSINFPSITFSEDTDTGFTRTASGTISVISDGTKVAQFPTGQGSNGQVLVTDGGGNLSYSSTITSPIVSGDLTIPDKIVHTGDTNTAIRFPAADAVSVETGGNEAIRVDSSQRLLVGTDSARTPGAIAPILQVEGTSSNTTTVSITRNSANNDGGRVIFNKSRGASNGSDVVVQDGDTLGQIVFCANDGTDSDSVSASILSSINGTPGSNDVPGKLVFSTTADGAASPTARLTIDSSGNVGIGTTSPARKVHLHESTSGNNFISFTNSTTGSTSGDGILVGMDSDESLLISNKENNHIALATSNTERMRLDSSGRLLIGKSSTSLTHKLQVQAATDANAIAILGRAADDIGELNFYENDGTTKLGDIQYRTTELNIRHRSEDAEINFATVPSGGSLTDQLTIKANGQVGIGTTAPAVNNKLHLRLTDASLASASTASTLLVENNGNTWITIGSNASYYGGILFADSASSDTGQLRYLHSDNRMEFIVNNTERMRITSTGDVGIGTTNPGTKLDVAGDIRVKSSGVYKAGHSGSASAPLYTTNDADTGMFSGGSNQLAFATGSTERMRIDSSGNLVLGSSTASGALTVVSTKNAESGRSNAQNYHLHLRNNENDNGEAIGISFGITSSSTGVGASILHERDSTGSQGSLQFYTNGDGSNVSERMRIASDGKVGINIAGSDNTSPVRNLDIADSSGAILRLISSDDSLSAGDRVGAIEFFTDDDDSPHVSSFISAVADPSDSFGRRGALRFGTRSDSGDATEKVRIDHNGNVGIGTTSPSRKLHVASSFIRVDDGYGLDTSGSTEKVVLDNGFVAFHVGSERMRIDDTGRVMIGTTSNSMDGVNGDLNIANDNANNNTVINCSRNTTADRAQIRFSNPNGNVGSITTHNSATSFNTSSDYRLKENATAISDGITRLKTLKPYRFNFKTDATTTVDGFFAHEVSSVVPQAITGTKDAVVTQAMIDAGDFVEGTLNNPIYQSIDHSKLVPLLVASLQESISKIETLETKVAALETA